MGRRRERTEMLSVWSRAAACLTLVVLGVADSGWAQEVRYVPLDLPQAADSAFAGPQEMAAPPAFSDLLYSKLIPRVWTIDYRVRSINSSQTSYEFGTPELPPDGWAPLSRLQFPLNAIWNGVQIGVEQPGWAVHAEWLTPMQHGINGNLEDFDWMDPATDFTDLGVMREHWLPGSQMVNLGLDVRLWQRPFDLPLEVWPTIGFRWQRFDIMAYDLVQPKDENVWPVDPYVYDGDVIHFCQDYYIAYVGGQIRTQFGGVSIPPTQMTFQADWGATEAYNIDHHLLREGDRYTMERTRGDSWHLGWTTESMLTKNWSLGFEAEYLQIRTKGEHRWVNKPQGIDESWSHGVRVWSDQLWLTLFVRLRI